MSDFHTFSASLVVMSAPHLLSLGRTLFWQEAIHRWNGEDSLLEKSPRVLRSGQSKFDGLLSRFQGCGCASFDLDLHFRLNHGTIELDEEQWGKESTLPLVYQKVKVGFY